MNTRIYWFSATGNSLAVARQLASALGETVLQSIPDALEQGAECNEPRVGIVFPVYMFGLPRIVGRFCDRLQVRRDAYLFGVATSGGMPGAALAQLRDGLTSRGLPFASGWAITMPGNYTPLYGAKPPEVQARILASAKEKTRHVAEEIKQKRQGVVEGSSWLLNLIFSRWLYPRLAPRIPAMDRNFRADEKCNGCGVCERVCPVANIRLERRRPIWLGRCEQCMACLQWCPQEAIQYGRRTAGRRRYHHPDVTAQDLFRR